MRHETSLKILLLVGILAYAAGAAVFTYSASTTANRTFVVDTTVNITNSLPQVLSVIIENATTTNITLNAGSVRNVTCYAAIRDYNGGSTIDNVSATLFNNASVNSLSPDDNNTHYTNPTCYLGNYDTYNRNVSCSFQVQYYANVGSWLCNVTATDPYAFSGNTSRKQSNFNKTYIDALLAINVTQLINYGDLAVGDTSAPQEANVTNMGNQFINISVKGYARNITDGLALICDVGNISLDNEKFNLIGGSDLSTYTNLTNVSQQIGGLTIPQQTNDAQQEINTTYWILYVPPNPFGRCNGTIIFQAERS